ncbi:MAG: SDR family oxidoreductase [Pseudomonadales bacterium]|jgi:NAD(P)-dependent dehydrogenase (short-subunit alcohol dehydrogenase family)|nr:SDR family oxidoreductase [Pseudomonadales bacterium]
MKCLLITGASTGIGLQTALQFIKAGYHVVNLSRRPCPVAEVTHLNCDLANPNFLESIENELVDVLKNATQIVLLHNAAKLANDQIDNTSSDALREVLEINIVAPNSLNRFVLPHMKPGSSIIYVGSTLSEKAVPGSFSYVTSKHASVGMMRATCQDLAGREIHTACVCPGFTDTEMLRTHVPEDVMPAIANMSAFGRLVSPDEIADTLLWAAGHPVINGAVLHANLGQVER